VKNTSNEVINAASLVSDGRGGKLTITVLVDNSAPDNMLAEHGFAAWIEAGDMCILFDTGQGLALVPNADHLGIDLSRADALVLSHGHYDHTGGIPAFLAVNTTAHVFHARGADIHRLSCHPGSPARSIGIPEKASRALNNLSKGMRIELDASRELAPGIGMTGPIPRLTAFEDAGGPFFFDVTQEHPDPIADDLSLWFETSEGLVILCGCCHSGLVNTISHVRQISGTQRIHGIMGGLHLLHANEERLDATLAFLAKCQPDFIAPCHCTGAQAQDRLRNEFGDRVLRSVHAGLRVEAGTLKILPESHSA
jgi:7,8-dihydropterin-6-yl-methyl-4-(beta-D-ribofuranosyl)aminobenzene 5'-phosphate synthase